MPSDWEFYHSNNELCWPERPFDITPDMITPPGGSFLIQLEDASGFIQLEDASGFIELEDGP